MGGKLERAGIISRQVQLLRVDLVWSVIDSRFDVAGQPSPESLKVGFNCGYEIRTTDGDERLLLVTVECEFVATDCEPLADHEPEGEPLLSVRADYRLAYRILGDEALPSDALHCFAWLNGPYNAWPYWREYVQSASARTGVEGIVLPVFRPNEATVPDPPAEDVIGVPPVVSPRRKRSRQSSHSAT